MITHSKSRYVPTIIEIDVRCLLEKQYRLYGLQTQEASFYVISVSDGGVYSAETFFSTHEDIKEIFDVICDGGLCGEHLCDVATDYKHALIC